MSSVVIQSHSVASHYVIKKRTDEVEESGEPHNPESIAVDASNEPSVHKELLHSSIHIVEIELLVRW